MEETWQENVWASPLAIEFTDTFGGIFGIHLSGAPFFYELEINGDCLDFDLPDNKAECVALISQSLKENKNLLLALPSSKFQT